jgi:hypothetical protein
MTDLTRHLTRVTGARVRGVPLVARLTPHNVTLRPFGTRTAAFSVPWDAIYDLGAKLQARELERGKRERRSPRRPA